ncbi:cysteine/glutathione ABC transporter ATP-binding protein/permease CydC [Shewanella sp. NIFS-20-20]|uniref:heme ABC transporter ATP-binding protein/permease CydC n=1 Tax=Shewanella sp. NIFS-20-20 TaxID=2853806 RepID=UPI001C4521F3|nr:cysteine/glutathione ABC transporter ATP-binding protein/permease CydC [Shewanella sp. NIFS-20-20]MBV7314707.1 cysteine/glutathione ABC transporter ATP-binding protein/permease CydC [Shewanella sp. NIFS-20-20]
MRVLLPLVKLFSRQALFMSLGILLSVTTLATGFGLLSLSGWFLSATAVAGLTVATAQAFNFFTPAGGVRFLSITRTASRYGERLVTHEATFRLLTELRVHVWQKIMPLSAANLKGLRQGDMLNRLVADIDTLDHLYLRLLTPVVAALIMMACLYGFLSWFDAGLAKILVAALLLAWCVLPALFYWLGKDHGRALVNTKRQYRIKLVEFIQGQAELTLFGADRRYRAQLDNAEQALLLSQHQMAKVTALSQAALVVASGAVILLMLVLAAKGVGEHVPPGPMFALMVFAAMACLEMLMPLAGAFQHLSSCVLAAQRLDELTSQTSNVSFGASAATISHGKISISQLRFGYRADVPVLNGIDLDVKAGTKVALLGQTGSGKSSLLALLTRDWLPESGDIKIDGTAIADFQELSLRSGMSVMSQRVVLLSASLRDNLKMALLPDQTISDAKLLAVLERVGLRVLTQGDNPLGQWLGDGGRQLSGGERRRIGIARLLLRDAPLLLLDEPTEGLDKRTEREILALLFDFAKDKTVLMISHRLTAMNFMDDIHLLDNGVITASGDHRHLLATNAYYQSLYQRI